MRLKLGGEFELKDVDVKTSTIEARKLFLELIIEMRTDVVADLTRLFNSESIPSEELEKPARLTLYKKLFLLHTKEPSCYSADLTELGFKPDVRKTPVLAYFDFIFKNQTEFDELFKESEIEWQKFSPNSYPESVAESAIEKLIPDWKTLKTKKDSEWLCSELSEWAEKWNLKDEWCLDFALDCLKTFKSRFVDRLRLPDNYLQTNDFYSIWELDQFQRNAMASRRSLADFWKENLDNYWFTSKIPNYPVLNYVWNEKTDTGRKELFTVEGHYNPLTSSPDEFRKKTEEQFWDKFFGHFSERRFSFVGNTQLLIDELKKFQKCVNNCISKVETVMKPFVQRTTRKKSGDKHFRWLVDYQISGKSFNKLSAEEGVDRKAIMDGIKGVAEIIGLTLRKPTKSGRRQGSKDLVARQSRRSRNF